MARMLVVDSQTVELRVALQSGCRQVLPAAVVLTITRMDAACQELPPSCDDACHRSGPPVTVRERSPAKVYVAARIEPGMAVFVIDHDLTEAPAGWYLGRVAVAEREVAMMMILVRNEGLHARGSCHKLDSECKLLKR
jgi:hypothetical protein